MAQCVKIGGERIEVEAKTVRLRVGDWSALDTAFPNGGARVAIRTLVASYVDNIRAKAAAALGRPLEEIHDPLPKPKTNEVEGE